MYVCMYDYIAVSTRTWACVTRGSLRPGTAKENNNNKNTYHQPKIQYSVESSHIVEVTSALPVTGVGCLRVTVLLLTGTLYSYQCCLWAVLKQQSSVGLLLFLRVRCLCHSWQCQASVTFSIPSRRCKPTTQSSFYKVFFSSIA